MIDLPFPAVSEAVLQALAGGSCASVTGLSNTGKTTLMHALSSQLAADRYRQAASRQPALIYIDCNRAVALSAQAFYELVLRSLIEFVDLAQRQELSTSLRAYHLSVIEAETAFQASLSFNLALNEACSSMGNDVVLLIDEFDEIYASLDDRALLNLRALRDRFRQRLLFVTATVRSLPRLRGSILEDEFAEMFAYTTYTMPPLSQQEALSMLSGFGGPNWGEAKRQACWAVSGGHPGLLLASAKVLLEAGPGWEADPVHHVLDAAGPRAECLKMWNQLTQAEQEDVIQLTAEPSEPLAEPRLDNLTDLGLIVDGQLPSPLLHAFIQRRRHVEGAVQGIAIDPDSGDVTVDGLRVPLLTDLEFRLLQLLDERRDKLTDKYLIVTRVWGEEYLDEVDDARVEKLISRLRMKVEPDPGNPRFLVTVRGRGYKLVSNPPPE